MLLAPHIEVNPGVCHGRRCIEGTRILVSVVLENLAAGQTPDEIVASYGSLTPDNIRAALAYSAQIAREHEGR